MINSLKINSNDKNMSKIVSDLYSKINTLYQQTLLQTNIIIGPLGMIVIYNNIGYVDDDGKNQNPTLKGFMRCVAQNSFYQFKIPNGNYMNIPDLSLIAPSPDLSYVIKVK